MKDSLVKYFLELLSLKTADPDHEIVQVNFNQFV
jgi:hypothetical protein